MKNIAMAIYKIRIAYFADNPMRALIVSSSVPKPCALQIIESSYKNGIFALNTIWQKLPFLKKKTSSGQDESKQFISGNNHFIITRMVTNEACSLIIAPASGRKLKKPRAIFNLLARKISFDISAFLKLASHKQLAIIQEISAKKPWLATLLSDYKIGLRGGRLTLNGELLYLVDQEVRLKFSLLLTAAMNPSKKIIKVSDARLLQPNMICLFTNMIKDTDYQLWLEQHDGRI